MSARNLIQYLLNTLNIAESLWDFLRRLKIIKEDYFQHDYFGDVKKLVTTVKTNYILNYGQSLQSL